MALQTLGYGLWPQRYLHWCTRKYGDRFTLRLATIGITVVVTDAASIRDVFGLKPHEFSADSTMLEPFLGSKSVLCQDGELHARERRLLATPRWTGGAQELRRRDGGHHREGGHLESWPVGPTFTDCTRDCRRSLSR